MHRHIVKKFLSTRLRIGAKLLLGFSGGGDSTALLHLLLEAQKELDFSLHLAHIDHSWRQESAREAQALEQLAGQLGLPFHLRCLKKVGGSDLENRARQERYAFFSELQDAHHFQALLLAHHRQDQGETVFKRVAEGSGIQGLGGLYPERKLNNLLIWRPLLPVKKEDLTLYLQKKKAHFFEDITNQDQTYLRARMRVELFPHLEKIFGKKIEGNFAKLGTLCQELSSYFEDKRQEVTNALVTGPFGSYLDLNLGFHPLEIKYFLKGIAPVTHDALEILLKLIQRRSSSRLIHAFPYTFQLSRSHLFLYKDPFPDFFQQTHKWKIGGEGDWKAFWQGVVKAPTSAYDMQKLSDLAPRERKKIKKWYQSSRVPSFFYDKAPIFVREGEVIGECLTGKHLFSIN